MDLVPRWAHDQRLVAADREPVALVARVRVEPDFPLALALDKVRLEPVEAEAHSWSPWWRRARRWTSWSKSVVLVAVAVHHSDVHSVVDATSKSSSRSRSRSTRPVTPQYLRAKSSSSADRDSPGRSALRLNRSAGDIIRFLFHAEAKS